MHLVKFLFSGIFQSADEKLRSLGHKGHHSSKPNTNTYCGAQNGQSDPSNGSPVTISRFEAPHVPPPPIPIAETNQNQQNKSHDQQSHFELTNQNTIPPREDNSETGIPPPIFPKHWITQMAERRYQRQNRKAGTNDEKSVMKKRSRSEGPHGRKKLRNSMHETSNKNNQFKQAANGRHSMYTGHVSDDDDVRAMHSGSESPNSDIADQRWTKNPLIVKKSHKSDKISKTDKRRSVQNVENRINVEQSGEIPYQVSQSRDCFIYPRKTDNALGTSHKARFHRMEENRKKRIDIAVTSDEECSPQLRISRLRQRAMLSSMLDNNQGLESGINIVPVRDDSSFTAYQEFQNGISQFDKSGQNRLSQYDEITRSKYDENYNNENGNGNFCQEYTKPHRLKQNKLPNVLPEYLPENRLPVNVAPPRDYHSNNIDHVTKSVTNQIQNARTVQPKQEKQNRQRTHQSGVKLSSESPKLRSFNEVKTNQPTQLKKADQKIELNPRSPNSSSDSLDDLIESNIQYLESEIESGKLKRQSGNYSNYSQEKVIQRQVIREPLRPSQTAPVQDEFRSRLQDPRTYVSSKLMSTATKAPKTVQNISVIPPKSNAYSSQCPNSVPAFATVAEPRKVPQSGSATYSPYMQRKSYEVNEDVSKSDSQLNAVSTKFMPLQTSFQATKSYAPYPVLNKQTGNVIYVQPSDNPEEQILMSENGIVPVGDAGMFSDVEYDIEISERIKKWEKKLTPGELEEKRSVLNTIKEYESFSDSNQKDVPDTPVEVRRELWQLLSPTDNSGIGKLSVNLARSTTSVSDSNIQDPNHSSQTYFEPKVVSSETNLHRIFRVVNEPRPRRLVTSAEKVKHSMDPMVSMETVNVQRRHKKPAEHVSHTKSMSNVTLSESEIGSNMQQSWPPMVVDSDSGIRKSWRMSRYEEEINELKELVSDNFRDIRKRFDSDMSETDTQRASSPVSKEQCAAAPVAMITPVTTRTSSGTSKLTLNIQPVIPTNVKSPITIRRKLSDQVMQNYVTPPASPGVPVTPKMERKLPIYRNVPVEAKTVVVAVAPQVNQTLPELKQSSAVEPKLAPDVWSPNMESRKGLVSMERVKARTLQTIPFSEDPVWKEIEGLATFEKPDGISKEVNFDEIDELLKLATGGMENLKSKSNSNFDRQMKRLTSSDVVMETSSSQASTQLTQSYMPTSLQMQISKEKHQALSDSKYPPVPSSQHTFNPPTIQPLKLNSKMTKKSSTSALDEVLEDIRATLLKKPLSPKLMKNLDTSESNSSANLSLQSPLTKSSKSFVFPKVVQRAKTETVTNTSEVVKSSVATPGYDNTVESWKPAQNEVPPQLLQQIANVPYIDPEFTQLPYIINGNYHLDPKLLSDKLKNTGLANDSSDERTANQIKAFNDLPANQQALNSFINGLPANHSSRPETVGQSKPCTQELDQSVDDLRTLAQEVEYKLSLIKSRIVSADEDRLDNILLALRKFAPMTEQAFFNVKFTPNFESEKVKRSKLEDALSELEKMYESLDLDDKSMMDRASRREETIAYENKQERKGSALNSSCSNTHEKPNSDQTHSSSANASRILRRSQIDEIERQTQNEFEDITKSFQVLLDEVTKQCRTVAQGSSRYSTSDTNLFSPMTFTPQYSSQRPLDEIRQEPPRQQLKMETQSQHLARDSYSTAIKELESVAMGSTRSAEKKPGQSVMYLNLDQSKSACQKTNPIQRNNNLVSPTRNLDIQVQSKTVLPIKKSPTFSSGTSQFVSMATEFHRPVLASSVTRETSSSDTQDDFHKNTSALKIELNQAQTRSRSQPQGRGSGRFRKRGNIEHRKSMPTITRSVETQTVETQTDSPPSISDMKETFEHYRKASLQEIVSDTSSDFNAAKQSEENKVLSAVPNEYNMSSSEDEHFTMSKMRRSLSCPDIVALLEEFDKKEKEKEKRLVKVDKTNAKIVTKTPKSVKQRHENKSRIRSMQKDDKKLKQSEMATSTTSDGFDAPKSKPPIYPVWKYPGQDESATGKKNDPRKPVFGCERDFTKTASDVEQERSGLRMNDFDIASGAEETVVRRRTRSFGYEQDSEERPKSFHELIATFEQDPKRLEKIRTSGLRKCASEDSMFTDLILQNIYHSDSDLYVDDTGQKLMGTGVKLALEMTFKT